MEYVRQNEGEFLKVYDLLVQSTVGACQSLQSKLTGDQLARGKELAKRSEAIRRAKKELSNSGAAVDTNALQSAIDGIKGEAPAKLYYEHAVSISGRTEKVKEERELGIWKHKSIQSSSGQQANMFVAFANAAGLKRVPIFTGEVRHEAELMVISFAELGIQAISPLLNKPYDDKSAFNALKTLAEGMKKYGHVDVQAERYTIAEESEIAGMVRTILSKVRSI